MEADPRVEEVGHEVTVDTGRGRRHARVRRPRSGPGGGTGWCHRSRSREGGARGYAARVQTWEYATVPLIVHATKQILDQWGEDGWELVQVIEGPGGQGLVAYLKRPRQ